MHTETAYYESPLGSIEIRANEAAISAVLFRSRPQDFTEAPVSEVIRQCITQLDEYFKGDRIIFELPLQPEGTSFQTLVWKELQRIPYGETISYIELARRLGDEKVVRAAGAANGKNPVGIVIPCHRVIGANGKLVGYAGELWRKEWLLKHEAAFAPKKAGRLF